MLNLLPQFDKSFVQNMFAIQTDNVPYGLTIYYETTENTNNLDMVSTEEMTTYAGYLFECIYNLGYVEYAYHTTISSNNELEELAYTVLLKIERSQ